LLLLLLPLDAAATVADLPTVKRHRALSPLLLLHCCSALDAAHGLKKASVPSLA